MAATVGADESGHNQLLDEADNVGKPANPAADETTADAPAAARPGSYEAFMSSFANPGRWAGR